MNLDFLDLILEKCAFPADAVVFFKDLATRLIAGGLEEEFNSFIDEYYATGCDADKLDVILQSFSDRTGENFYSCWMLLLLLASERAKPLYEKRGVPDEIFWDTFTDLRCKALECKEVKGVWGTFVADWYDLFCLCRIIKFGRIEYQDATYDSDEERTYGNVTLTKGMKILSMHIPSSGEPFDPEARLKSYKMAFDFYTKELGEDVLVCKCGSWLLYPPYKKAFPENSNSSSFMDDFDLFKLYNDTPGEYKEFDDKWRVYGRDHEKPLAELPEDTAMRRGFKKYFLEGGRPGCADGYFVFDGEKVLTKTEH